MTKKEISREILKNKAAKDQIKTAVTDDIDKFESYFLNMSDEQLIEEVRNNPEVFRNLFRYVYNDAIIDMLEADLAELND